MSIKKITQCSVLSLLLFVAACSPMTHVVGDGAQGNSETTKRQMWIVNLVPLNAVDTNAMAKGAADYEITTKKTFIDLVLTGVCQNLISFTSVTVKK
ncbi:hypothetical protein OAC91_00190 [Candidatus Marinimicrobia bacterium]|jgi:hypothetical protein|nr:hypothetical protein [Candidatus Neomarinimicrobiota bacterium]|tara:strand:+ start:2711 stop:3001 length:291 start_codon:yes stop_codon:yes gene_type:complete